mmetsp:Transcript_124267/g.345915  ORF Transcript_124267/g.345915 Transcript_124267/m.345915 type:complete len:247 (+) Transcript_124267:382-1122(+)
MFLAETGQLRGVLRAHPQQLLACVTRPALRCDSPGRQVPQLHRPLDGLCLQLRHTRFRPRNALRGCLPGGLALRFGRAERLPQPRHLLFQHPLAALKGLAHVLLVPSCSRAELLASGVCGGQQRLQLGGLPPCSRALAVGTGELLLKAADLHLQARLCRTDALVFPLSRQVTQLLTLSACLLQLTLQAPGLVPERPDVSPKSDDLAGFLRLGLLRAEQSSGEGFGELFGKRAGRRSLLLRAGCCCL